VALFSEHGIHVYFSAVFRRTRRWVLLFTMKQGRLSANKHRCQQCPANQAYEKNFAADDAAFVRVMLKDDNDANYMHNSYTGQATSSISCEFSDALEQ